MIELRDNNVFYTKETADNSMYIYRYTMLFHENH